MTTRKTVPQRRPSRTGALRSSLCVTRSTTSTSSDFLSKKPQLSQAVTRPPPTSETAAHSTFGKGRKSYWTNVQDRKIFIFKRECICTQIYNREFKRRKNKLYPTAQRSRPHALLLGLGLTPSGFLQNTWQSSPQAPALTVCHCPQQPTCRRGRETRKRGWVPHAFYWNARHHPGAAAPGAGPEARRGQPQDAGLRKGRAGAAPSADPRLAGPEPQPPSAGRRGGLGHRLGPRPGDPSTVTSSHTTADSHNTCRTRQHPTAGPKAPSKPAGPQMGTGPEPGPSAAHTGPQQRWAGHGRVASSSPAACPQGVPRPDARLTYRKSRVLPAGILNFLPPRRLFQNGPRAPGLGGRRPARRRQHAPLLPRLPAGGRGSYERDARLSAQGPRTPTHKGFLHGNNLTVFCVFQKDRNTLGTTTAGTSDRGPRHGASMNRQGGRPRGSQRLHWGVRYRRRYRTFTGKKHNS